MEHSFVPTPVRRVALVSGPCDAIARAIFEALGRRDFSIIYVSSDTSASSDPPLIPGENVECRRCEVGTSAGRQALIEAIHDQHGRLDLLVNYAFEARQTANDILELSEADLDATIQAELKLPYFLSQAVANYFIELGSRDSTARGKIINVASPQTVADEPPVARRITRCGLTMLTQVWAHRLAEFGIAVYGLRPGAIGSATGADSPADHGFEGLTLSNRYGAPADVGTAVATLALDGLAFTTGNVIDLDGGLSLRRL